MKDLRTLNRYRIDSKSAMVEVDDPSVEGVFTIFSIMDRRPIVVLASGGFGWEHLSVSCADRTPHWTEMEQVKRMFFEENETAFQLHPPMQDYISGKWPGGRALFTLHLWRPTFQEIPRPPRWMVGANSQLEWDIVKTTVPKELKDE